MRGACVVRTRFILDNFTGIGLGVSGPPGPSLGYAHGGSVVHRTSEVAPHSARLVLRWVTVFGPVYHLAM